MIWSQKEINLSILNEINANTLVSHLGILFTEMGEDFLAATMPVDHRTKQPMGLLHGGASVVLSESLGSIASYLTVENPLATPVVGLEINANHLRSVKLGYVKGIVKPIKLGKTVHVWETKIFDLEENLCCISRLTTLIKKK
jgi:1,4-dihydroxy-2-naphthoyl-CoA hydrolase